MITEETPQVIGIFEKPEQAAAAVKALVRAGFPRKQIGVLARETSHEFDGIRVDLQHAGEEGAISGALAGGAAGVVAGVAGAALIPGVGPVVAGTLLAGALLGGAGGAALGTFAGPFVAMGFSEADAERHGRHLEQGKTVLLVHTKDRLTEARNILIDNGAYDETMSTIP